MCVEHVLLSCSASECGMKTPEELKAYQKEYRKTHAEDIKKQNKLKYERNKDAIKIHNKSYYEQNKAKIILQRNEYRKRHIDDIHAYTRVSCKKYRDANKEKERLRQRKYYKLHPEKLKAYRDSRKEKIAGFGKKYRETHKEQERLRQNKYFATPVGKITNVRRNHKRRDARKATVCNLTFEQWNTIIAEQNNCCAHCGKEFSDIVSPTQDHIVPISKGGGLTYENVQALCKSCNSKKCNRFECDLPYLKKHTTTTTTVVITQVTNWDSEE